MNGKIKASCMSQCWMEQQCMSHFLFKLHRFTFPESYQNVYRTLVSHDISLCEKNRYEIITEKCIIISKYFAN